MKEIVSLNFVKEFNNSGKLENISVGDLSIFKEDFEFHPEKIMRKGVVKEKSENFIKTLEYFKARGIGRITERVYRPDLKTVENYFMIPENDEKRKDLYQKLFNELKEFGVDLE